MASSDDGGIVKTLAAMTSNIAVKMVDERILPVCLGVKLTSSTAAWEGPGF